MLSVGNTLAGSGASLSLDARVAVGAGVFAVSAAETSNVVAETPVVSNSPQKLPAYNAFEFTYRSDFGKIILLRQDVETGQEVTQIPTEYHLQQYAATQRAQRVQQVQKLFGGSTGEPQGKSSQAKTQVTTTVQLAPAASGTSAPAASQPAAPSVAPSTVAAATVAHVDIKV